MSTVSLAEEILRDCILALRSVADYELEPALERRLSDLGERKEFLNDDEHAEPLDLVAFTRHRSVERLKARLALHRLGEAAPNCSQRPDRAARSFTPAARTSRAR